ncbi:MAG: Trm112 family protein [Burkholderiales bacterium]|nr:Trm112 family protein [Burkholderiales bacterium]
MDSKLLEILVCPICKAGLEYHKDKEELHCNKCKLAFPIDDGIPVMLIDEARSLENE